MLSRFPILLVLASLAMPALAQDAPAPDKPMEKPGEDKPAGPPNRPIRNAPSPRAVELSAYIFSAANVCGYRIGVPEFEALLAKMNTKPEDVSPRGPFGARIQSIFALMSNDMAKHREQSCLAVAGEYGPEGNIAKNVLLPATENEPATQAPPTTDVPASPDAPPVKPGE